MKKSKDEERNSEERLKILFEYAPDAYYLSDPKGNFIDGNLAAENLLGYKRSDLIGKNLLKLKLLSAKEISKAAKLLAKNFLGKSTGPDEFTLHRKDGTTVITEIRTYPVKIKNQTLVLGIARDITERKLAEETLRESEDKYRGIFESLQDVYYRTDKEGNVTIISPSVRSQAGYNPEDIIGHQVTDFYLNPSDRDIFKTKLKESGVINDFELKLLAKDGRVIDVSISAQIIIGKNGEPVGVEGILRDITERKRVEEALQRAKERAQLYLDIAGVMFVVLNVKGKVVLINQKGSEILGYEQEEIIGKNWFDNFLPLTIKDEVKTVFPRLIAGEIEPVEYYENPVLTRGREERIIAWHNTILEDDEGNIIGTLSSGEDITERKQAKEKLHESEEKFRGVFESSNDALMLMEEGRIVDCNSATLKIFGYENREEFINLHPSDISPPKQADGRDSLQCEEERIALAFREGPQFFEWMHRRANGEDFPAEVLLTPLELGGKEFLQATVRDISERKRMEEELERLAITDPLTGAYNRRYFLEKAQEEFQRYRRYGRPLSILMLDIDNFKLVNDKFGHHVGDEVLMGLVKECNIMLRATDTLGRLGGEEFAILLTETNQERALIVAERLRQKMANLSVSTEKESVPFTISIGLASFQQETESLDEVMKNADKALYEAKNSGRNCVVQV